MSQTDPDDVSTTGRTLAETLRENARLRVLVEVASALATARLDLPAVLDALAVRVAHGLGDWCIIRLISDDGLWLDTATVRHRDPTAETLLHTIADGVRHPVGQGLQGRVVTSDAPVLIRDMQLNDVPTATRTTYAQWYDTYGVGSLLIVPLRLDERVIGTLGLMRDAGSPAFTDAERDLALMLANHVAQAIHASRLYQQSEAAEARWRGVLDGVADAVLISDESGNYIDANPAAATLFGYSQAELRGMRVGDLTAQPLPDPDWEWRAFQHLLEEGQWRGESTMRRKDGSLVPVEAVVTGVRLPDGSTVYVGANRDVSERQRLEQLQHDFVQMVSHDLRSPLTSIRGLSQLMQRRGEYNEENLRQIIAQADRMQALLTDLLDIEQIELGHVRLDPVQIDLVDVVCACVAWANANGSQHHLNLDRPDEAVVGWWDRGRLEQICENLISNALKYTPDGGRIVVSVRRAGDVATIRVQDTGVGIPNDALPQLFNRFFRVDRDGSQTPSGIGLGLYITRMLVEAMDGEITVVSDVGRGSTFTVTLPTQSRTVGSLEGDHRAGDGPTF